jgi:hypothetical protein
MRNTPITDELAREFAGKRLSSREAGSVWSLCRDLEREIAEVTKQRDALADALQGYLTSTESGGAMQEMAKLSGRVLFYERLRECRKIAEQALADTKGGQHE